MEIAVTSKHLFRTPALSLARMAILSILNMAAENDYLCCSLFGAGGARPELPLRREISKTPLFLLIVHSIYDPLLARSFRFLFSAQQRSAIFFLD